MTEIPDALIDEAFRVWRAETEARGIGYVMDALNRALIDDRLTLLQYVAALTAIIREDRHALAR